MNVQERSRMREPHDRSMVGTVKNPYATQQAEFL